MISHSKNLVVGTSRLGHRCSGAWLPFCHAPGFLKDTIFFVDYDDNRA